MHKRKLKRNDVTSSKKSKCCYFPLYIYDIVKLIASYLEGDHLLHFKLTCKTLYEFVKEMSCMIKITLENIERTTSTPGFHIIEINSDSTLDDYIKHSQKQYPLVVNLIIDYCGIKSNSKYSMNHFPRTFKNLHSLRIIRCRDAVSIMILKYMKNLSILEIYSTRNITMYFARDIEYVRLCSTGKRSQIRVKMMNTLDKNFSNILTYCYRFLIGVVGKKIPIESLHRDFVPNPNFI